MQKTKSDLSPFTFDQPLKRLFLIFLIVKILIILLIVASYFLLLDNELNWRFSFQYEEYNKHLTLSSALATWDGQHYLQLAEHWYAPDHRSNAFYPLYPILIILVKTVALNPVVSGYIVSAILGFFALKFLYVFVKTQWDEKTAWYACLCFIASPMSFYLHIIYSESLFLALVLLFFNALYLGNFTLAGVSAFFLPLSRPQGVLVAVPLFVYFCTEHLGFSFKGYLKRFGKLSAVAAALLLGFGAYLLLMYVSTGTPFAGFDAQKVFISQNSILRLFQPIQWFRDVVIGPGLSYGYLGTSLVDRGSFLLYVAILPLIYRYTNPTLFTYSLVIGVTSGMASGVLMSFPRYLLMVFPIFILMGMLLKKYPATRYVTLAGCGIFQGYFLILHSLYYWVA